MRYSASAQLIVEALKESREPGNEYFRIGRALVDILDLIPGSVLAAVLHEEDVWVEPLRRAHRNAMAGVPRQAQSASDGGGSQLAAFLRDAEEIAAKDHASEVDERHITKALVRNDGALFKQFGINWTRLAQRVEELELGAREAIQPSFDDRKASGESDLCFVLMPFANDFDVVYANAIKPAVQKSRLRCERADESARPGIVVEHIQESIGEARVIIADITGRNPNVMIEVGHAQAHRKPIIFITQNPLRDLPFDVRHYRAQQYDTTSDGLAALAGWIVAGLVEVLRESFHARLTSEGSQGGPTSEPLRLPLDYVQRDICPRLEEAGYSVVLPTHNRADVYRLKGWENVFWPDAAGRPRLVLTEDLTPLKMRR